MQIAMTAPDLTLLLALREQRFLARERVFHCLAKASNILRREDFGRRFEGNEGLLDLALQGLACILSRNDRRALVRCGDDTQQVSR